jgi:hypothetical protein
MPAFCNPKPDHTIYLVECRYRDVIAWAERDSGRTNRHDTLEDIYNGALSNVVRVLEIEPTPQGLNGLFSTRDVTEDFALAIEHPTLVREAVDRLAACRDHAHDLIKHDRDGSIFLVQP